MPLLKREFAIQKVGASQRSLNQLWDSKAQSGDFDNNDKSARCSKSEDDDSDIEWNIVDKTLVKALGAELSKYTGKVISIRNYQWREEHPF
jgi:hypothetical protein